MKKIVILGDSHGRDTWKEIVDKEKPDQLICLGDYFDSFNITAEVQINNFLDLIEYKKSGKLEVILLIGNHDSPSYIDNPGITSGYQKGAATAIKQVLLDNKEHLQMCYILPIKYELLGYTDKLLFTHAGVSEVFLDYSGWDKKQDIAEFLNDLYKYKPLSFMFMGVDHYGDDITQTPVWIRPKSLVLSSPNLMKEYIQIVGHTTQSEGILVVGNRYIFADALGKKEYIVIENETLTIKQLDNDKK